MGEVADYEVVIVGCGPVGAVAANLAGQAGLRTLVVERSDEPYRLPRAILFDAEIMRVFEAIGLADKIAAITRPLAGSIYLGADHKPIRSFRAAEPAHELAWHPSNLFYQPQLEALLREGIARFPSVTVMERTEFLGIVGEEEGGVTLDLSLTEKSEPFRVHSNYVLGCDGASSSVRKALDVQLDDIGFEERWLVVDTWVRGPMRWPTTHEIPAEVRDGRYSLMVCDPERPATLIPGVGQHRRWEYMLFPEEHPGDEIPEQWLRSLISQWVDPADVEVVRSAVYRFRALVARDWRRGAVFLVGDAAHQTPPFYGQGMCHGIRDAAQLMWKLKRVCEGTSPSEILDTYQIEREPHVREIIRASVNAGAAVCKTDPAQAAARDAEFRAIEQDRASRPVAMSDVVPPLRDGLIDGKTGGLRFPELLIATSTDEIVRADRFVAGKFSLFSLDQSENQQRLTQLDIQIVPLDINRISAPGSVENWLDRMGSRWVLVRPDRYVHSHGSGIAALSDALTLLANHLGAEPLNTLPAL